MERTPDDRVDLQSQVDDLARQTTDNRIDIESLTNRADKSDDRADALDARVDAMEARARIDRDMITDLQTEGLVSNEQARQLEEALKSSRTIGAAIGVLMASRELDEDEAFTMLKKASQSSNRKLREIAAEIVSTNAAPAE